MFPATELDLDLLLRVDLIPLMSTIVVALPVDTALVVMDTVTEVHPAVATTMTIAVVIVLLQEPVAQLTTTHPHVAALRIPTVVIIHLIHMSTAVGPHMIALLPGITPQEMLHTIMRDHRAVTESRIGRGYDAVPYDDKENGFLHRLFWS